MTDWLDKSLQQLAAEDPPAEALAEVRLRVHERVQPKRRAWLWTLVPAAAAAGLAIWFSLPTPTVPQAQPPVVIAQAPPAPPVQQVQPVKPALAVRPKAAPRPKPIELAQATGPRILPTGSPDFVQIESGNPDVVILWSMNSPTVTDRTGENK
ncbi:MAG TPA: hypothetical protein PKJ41_09275 [Bryobacteraceae bacterium]|nr:hypothetical protein [Bryobacteraceae bacterium]HPT27724.1 hypothetical protein [Bryobacteraceae bacterium]